MSDERRAYPVLYVDDEPQNLATFRYAFENAFTVLTASSGEEAISLLQQHDVAVLVCDQRMPGMTGVEVCRRSRDIRPNAARIILTAYADMQVAMDAINQGQVLRFLTKPWRNDEMTEVLRSAVELVRIRKLIQEMQSRILRGGDTSELEAMARQIAAELQAPVARLHMNLEQVQDLLTAALSNWKNSERAHELLRQALGVQQKLQVPVSELSNLVQKLAVGQRPPTISVSGVSDVSRVARAAVSILHSTLDPGIRLDVHSADSPVVRMVPADLGQVLVHLIMNAANALEMGRPEKPAIAIVVARTSAGVEITVGDNGPGIPPDRIQRIFDPGFSTRAGASGLGLSVVRRLVEQATGTVVAESQVGKGSRFIVRLPTFD